MKTTLTLVFTAIALFSTTAQAHPGRTASDGCHYCRTNCDKWGVPWNSRHCHNGVKPEATDSLPHSHEDGVAHTHDDVAAPDLKKDAKKAEEQGA